MVDGTLAIDLCLLKGARAIDLAPGEVGVDGSVGYLECSGGSVLGEVDEAGRARGWVTTVGHVGSTGAGGLILQGGHGFLERKLGLSVDLLVEVDIVLASGELVTASETSHSHEDLFWAVRGGGGNFGIVTRFKLRAFELPKVILGGARIHAPLSMGWFPDRPELIKKWAALFDEKSDNSATGMLVLPCGGPVVEGLVYLGDPEEGKRVFAAHRKSVGFPLKDGVKPCSYYDDVQKFAPAHRGNFYNTGFMVPEITAEFADALAELALKANAPGSNTACALVVIPSSGKASTPAPGKTCVGTRDCRFWVLVVAEWKGLRGSPQAEDAKVRAMRWIDTVKARLSPLVNGKSYGVLGDVASHGEHKQERKYNRDVYGEFLPRLREIKTKYDPKNIFQINDNIQPLV
jgi:FAD/FMN-containing dehydrogenase